MKSLPKIPLLNLQLPTTVHIYSSKLFKEMDEQSLTLATEWFLGFVTLTSPK